VFGWKGEHRSRNCKNSEPCCIEGKGKDAKGNEAADMSTGDRIDTISNAGVRWVEDRCMKKGMVNV